MVSRPRTSVLVVGARARRLAKETSLRGVEMIECRDFAQVLPAVRARHARLDAILVDSNIASPADAAATLTLIRSAAREWPWLPIVTVAGRGCGATFIRDAFLSGARDVVLRPLRPGELTYALLRLVRGGQRGIGRGERSDAALNEVIAAVERSYGHPVSARSLAATAGLSRWRFSRRFREVTGMSFRAYVAAVRLARARHLLVSSRRSITDIAHDVGFYDLPHFDRTFRAWFGVTPLAFRRQATRTAGIGIAASSGRPRRAAATEGGPRMVGGHLASDRHVGTGKTRHSSPSTDRATGNPRLAGGRRRAS
jgi:AraC-like DNA-binding protein